MDALLHVLAGLVGLASLVCTIIILIEAFKDAVWKGILCLVTCGLYMLYYALFEFEHDNKWPIVLLAYGGGAISGCILALAH